MKSSTVKLRVRYPETDKMGVVHHTNYFVYFEIGRLEYLRDLGLPYIELEKEGFQLAVHEARCTYKASARFDDVLVVETWLSRLTYTQMELSYKISREESNDGSLTLLADGTTKLVCIDEGLRPKRIPNKIRDLLPPTTSDTSNT